VQALKFGAQFAISRGAVALFEKDGIHELVLSGGGIARTRTVIVASGERYRTLELQDYTRFENCGVFYAATAMESLRCMNHEVIVVGGGNSAGQAAVFLSGIAAHVHLVVRAKSLDNTMSQYLISRIQNSDRITLHTETKILGLEGGKRLERVILFRRGEKKTMTMAVPTIFVMIGAEPNSGCLFGSTALDKKGFVLSGAPYGFENTPQRDESRRSLRGGRRSVWLCEKSGVRCWRRFRCRIRCASLSRGPAHSIRRGSASIATIPVPIYEISRHRTSCAYLQNS
jgi:thioredoxin reductase (NADPH)